MGNSDAELIDLFNRIAQEVAGRSLPGLTRASSLFELGLDSIAVAGIIGRLEKTLGVRIPNEDLAGVTTIGDLADLFRRLT